MTATTTYHLPEDASLVLRVNDGPWQTLTFEPGEATGEELAAASNGLDGIKSTVDDEGRLVLSTEETGETTVLEVDATASTAAAALGLSGTGTSASATGNGPGSATLTSVHAGPYELPADAALTVQVDGKSRNLTFGKESKESKESTAKDEPWTAEAVAAHLNRQLRRKVARPTGDGRIRLTSPTQGVGSSLDVTGPAAAVLGFTGAAAHSDPYRSEPATLTCRPPTGSPGSPASTGNTVVENLTPAPIELQLPTGRCLLPARGRLVVAREIAADSLLLRLGAQGTVRMSPERTT